MSKKLCSPALLLAAVAFAMPTSAALAKDIVLGASVQLTGPVANTGRYYRDAYQIRDRQDQCRRRRQGRRRRRTSSRSSFTTTSPTST